MVALCKFRHCEKTTELHIKTAFPMFCDRNCLQFQNWFEISKFWGNDFTGSKRSLSLKVVAIMSKGTQLVKSIRGEHIKKRQLICLWKMYKKRLFTKSWYFFFETVLRSNVNALYY